RGGRLFLGPTTKVYSARDSQHGRMVAYFALFRHRLVIEFADELRRRHSLLACERIQYVPELVFETNAGHVILQTNLTRRACVPAGIRRCIDMTHFRSPPR